MVADEILLELLHAELVNYVCSSECKESAGQLNKHCNLSTLEYFGFSTGYKLIERFTKDWPRLTTELDTIKFICTDFWSSIYKKSIDNLRTNHQGVYVLHDQAFRFLAKISNGTQYLDSAPLYIAFTSGLLRGALANLGINSIVTAEVQPMPACKFHIQVLRNQIT
ncbi:Trafficking protein particle complex subunit [Nesidiocoris tenuis]|uniref:Trafficking protein particle complex subunit n=1 Tax=Nesidiocoris tenuis TaxID=355587 RepID=A0ABN7B2R0_9HEMI|nr:Trafficking protein particle complex subunit [Nesidiocoris tenuis]